MAQDKAAAILAALEAQAAARGVDIVDVEVVGATKAPTVRVRIDWAEQPTGAEGGNDAPAGISLDDVAAQTGWVSDAIDELDPFPGSFTLEVSSPGLDRPLRRERDFERFVGEQVSLTTTATEGRKRFFGELVGLRDGAVVLACDGEQLSFPLAEVRRCQIKPSFGTPSKKSAK